MKLKLHHYLFALLVLEICYVALFLFAAWTAKSNLAALLIIMICAVILGLKAAYMLSYYVPRRGISDGVVYFIDLLSTVNYILILVGGVIIQDIVWYGEDTHNVTQSVVVIYYIMIGIFSVITLLYVVTKIMYYQKYKDIMSQHSTVLPQEIDEDEMVPFNTQVNTVIDIARFPEVVPQTGLYPYI